MPQALLCYHLQDGKPSFHTLVGEGKVLQVAAGSHTFKAQFTDPRSHHRSAFILCSEHSEREQSLALVVLEGIDS